MGKRANARVGAFLFLAVWGAALVLTMANDWLGMERYERRNLLYDTEQLRFTTCGLARSLPLAGAIDWLPCQFWNLMPLSLIGLWAGVWLLKDLVRARD